MPKKPPPDPKSLFLRQQGCLNPHSEGVTDELFQSREFFDPRDLVQEGLVVEEETADGCRAEAKEDEQQRERPDEQGAARENPRVDTLALGPELHARHRRQVAGADAGLGGEIGQGGGRPAERLAVPVAPGGEEEVGVVGPLSPVEVDDPSLRLAALVSRIQERYGIAVHPRSIERALVRGQKKPR